MGGEFRSEEAEESRQRLKQRIEVIQLQVQGILDALDLIYYDKHKSTGPRNNYPGVDVNLHDEIAAAEDLNRMLNNVDIYYTND